MTGTKIDPASGKTVCIMCDLPIHACQTINWLRIAVESFEAGNLEEARMDKQRAWQEFEKYISAAKH